jgi:ribonuclease D
MDSPAPHVIDTSADWQAVAPIITRAARLALDMEADGFHRYPEHVALIQIALPDRRVLLLDPLAVPDLAALGAVLGDPGIPKVFHSADYDVRSLDRDHGFRIAGLFDTAIAAQLCGSTHTGLANVLTEYRGVSLAKSKQLQRLDWSRRPLPPEALSYAADDVAYLFDLADTLAERLSALGRTAWVAEECHRLEGVRYRAPDPPEEAFLGVTGARDLTNEARAVMRELYVWREAEARRSGRPPFKLVSNQVLLTLAQSPDGAARHLSGVNRRWLDSVEPGLAAALARGRAAAPVPWPRRPRGEEWLPVTQARLKHLKAWRTAEAERLGLDAGIVWPADHLKQVALHPGAASRALDHGEPHWVRDWQWATLGASLDRFRRETLQDALR